MNQLTIIGGLTRDPESRTTPSGKQVCTFSVGVNRRNDREQSDYFRVSAWNDLGNNCMRYLRKGSRVSVVGSVSASAYTAQDGTARANLEVFARDVEFLTPKSENDSTSPSAPQTANKADNAFVQVEDDDLPF